MRTSLCLLSVTGQNIVIQHMIIIGKPLPPLGLKREKGDSFQEPERDVGWSCVTVPSKMSLTRPVAFSIGAQAPVTMASLSGRHLDVSHLPLSQLLQVSLIELTQCGVL